jgi:hypothetical protein
LWNSLRLAWWIVSRRPINQSHRMEPIYVLQLCMGQTICPSHSFHPSCWLVTILIRCPFTLQSEQTERKTTIKLNVVWPDVQRIWAGFKWADRKDRGRHGDCMRLSRWLRRGKV